MDAPTTAALNWGEIAQRVKGQQGYTAMMRWGKVAHGLTKTEDVVRMQHELMKVRAQWPNTTGAAGKRGIINWRPDMEAMGATEYPSNENSDPTQPGVFAMYDSLYNMRRERSWMKRISRTKWDGTHNWQIQVFRTHRVRASVAAHNMEHPRLTSFVETRQGTSTEAGIAIDIPEDIARGTQFQMEQRLIELLQSAAVEMDYTESHFVIRSFLGGAPAYANYYANYDGPLLRISPTAFYNMHENKWKAQYNRPGREGDDADVELGRKAHAIIEPYNLGFGDSRGVPGAYTMLMGRDLAEQLVKRPGNRDYSFLGPKSQLGGDNLRMSYFEVPNKEYITSDTTLGLVEHVWTEESKRPVRLLNSILNSYHINVFPDAEQFEEAAIAPMGPLTNIWIQNEARSGSIGPMQWTKISIIKAAEELAKVYKTDAEAGLHNGNVTLKEAFDTWGSTPDARNDKTFPDYVEVALRAGVHYQLTYQDKNIRDIQEAILKVKSVISRRDWGVSAGPNAAGPEVVATKFANACSSLGQLLVDLFPSAEEAEDVMTADEIGQVAAYMLVGPGNPSQTEGAAGRIFVTNEEDLKTRLTKFSGILGAVLLNKIADVLRTGLVAPFHIGLIRETATETASNIFFRDGAIESQVSERAVKDLARSDGRRFLDFQQRYMVRQNAPDDILVMPDVAYLKTVHDSPLRASFLPVDFASNRDAADGFRHTRGRIMVIMLPRFTTDDPLVESSMIPLKGVWPDGMREMLDHPERERHYFELQDNGMFDRGLKARQDDTSMSMADKFGTDIPRQDDKINWAHQYSTTSDNQEMFRQHATGPMAFCYTLKGMNFVSS